MLPIILRSSIRSRPGIAARANGSSRLLPAVRRTAGCEIPKSKQAVFIKILVGYSYYVWEKYFSSSWFPEKYKEKYITAD